MAHILRMELEIMGRLTSDPTVLKILGVKVGSF